MTKRDTDYFSFFFCFSHSQTDRPSRTLKTLTLIFCASSNTGALSTLMNSRYRNVCEVFLPVGIKCDAFITRTGPPDDVMTVLYFPSCHNGNGDGLKHTVYSDFRSPRVPSIMPMLFLGSISVSSDDIGITTSPGMGFGKLSRRPFCCKHSLTSVSWSIKHA